MNRSVVGAVRSSLPKCFGAIAIRERNHATRSCRVQGPSGIFKALEASLPNAEFYFSKRDPVTSYKSIGASGSMFRVFHGIDRPSVVYQKWAYDMVKSSAFDDLKSIGTQEQFEQFHFDLGQSLQSHWKAATGATLKFAHLFKLLDVFVKRACELELLAPETNTTLLRYGHVPLDSWVFVALDHLFSGALLLEDCTMGQVNDNAYRLYQQFVRQIMAPMNAPPLYFEYFAWNLRKDLLKQKA